MEIGFPLVGGEKGLKGSIIRARVFERKPEHKNYHGRWNGSWMLGEFSREKSPNQIILKSSGGTFRKREKSFSGVGKHR